MPRLTVSSDGLKEELINRLPHAHRDLLFDFRQGRWPLLSKNLKADWHALVEAPQKSQIRTRRNPGRRGTNIASR